MFSLTTKKKTVGSLLMGESMIYHNLYQSIQGAEIFLFKMQEKTVVKILKEQNTTKLTSKNLKIIE